MSPFSSDFMHLTVFFHFLSLREDLSILLIFLKEQAFHFAHLLLIFSSLLHLFPRKLSVHPPQYNGSFLSYFSGFIIIYLYLFPSINVGLPPLPTSCFLCDVVIGSLFGFLGTGVNCDKLYLADAFAVPHRFQYVMTLIELALGNC